MRRNLIVDVLLIIILSLALSIFRKTSAIIG